jgi:hypothetical protein
MTTISPTKFRDTVPICQYKIGTRDVFDGPCMTAHFPPTKSHDHVPYFQYKVGTRDVFDGPCMTPFFPPRESHDPVPFFQYKIGTRDVFDGKRRPAWTDRILYRVNTSNYDNYK